MKKFLCVVMTVLLLVGTLVSCGMVESDPVDLAWKLQEQDYRVSMQVSEGSLTDSCNRLGISGEKIVCVLSVYGDGGRGGFFFWMDSLFAVSSLKEDLQYCINRSEKYNTYVIESSGTMVYFGDPKIWKDAK